MATVFQINKNNSCKPTLNEIAIFVERTDRRNKLVTKIAQQKRKRQNKGFVLVLVMLLLCVMTAFSVSLCSMSGTKLQIANNHHNHNLAFCAAESGLEICKYWMVNDVNSFAGMHHVLSKDKEQSFIVKIELTTDPNTLAVIVEGRVGEFRKVIGGDFVNANPGWRFANETYWEK